MTEGCCVDCELAVPAVYVPDPVWEFTRLLASWATWAVEEHGLLGRDLPLNITLEHAHAMVCGAYVLAVNVCSTEEQKRGIAEAGKRWTEWHAVVVAGGAAEEQPAMRRRVSIQWLDDSARAVEALAAIYGTSYHIPPTSDAVRVDVPWHGQAPTLRLYCDADPGSAACAKALRGALAKSRAGSRPPAAVEPLCCGSCADWTPFSEYVVNVPSGAATSRDDNERDCGYCGSSLVAFCGQAPVTKKDGPSWPNCRGWQCKEEEEEL